MSTRLRRLNVLLGGNAVGTLAETPDREVFFEYASSWISEGFSISPYHLPLKAGLMQEPTRIFEGLFGVFDDSLPDGWGRLLTDRYFRKQGRTPESLSPLDRLAFVGRNAMGALVYEPAVEDQELGLKGFDLGELASHAERIVNGSPEEVLPVLRVTGGSSGGSRPKVLVSLDPQNNEMSSDLWDASRDRDDWEHWLIKFRAKEDPVDAGPIEGAYASMAKGCGIEIPETRIFESSAGRFFGIRRFDRVTRHVRLHAHTFGGLIHSHFRYPNRDYQEYLAIVFDLTKYFRQVEQAYRRAVFNVFAHNRDDHVKNFTFIHQPAVGWRLSPSYDLMWSHGVRGEHNMVMMGNGAPGTKQLFELAQSAGLSKHIAMSIIEEVRGAIATWPKIAKQFGVSSESLDMIQKDFSAMQ